MSGGRFDLERRDTICAPATAPGSSAIAVIRVSGPRADDVRARVFKRKRPGAQRPFVVTLGHVVDASAAAAPLLDEALCVSFPAGKSYTGEPSFELSLHGGRSRVVSALRSLVAAGCRLAEPGELTLRAVLTGRLDLARAEAVDDLVRARSDEAARVALRQLGGALGEALAPVRATVVDVLAELEARLDFPDEGLGEAARERLRASLDDGGARLAKLLSSATLGRRLVEGARVVLYGLPNAGKSTLLNALLGEERALVHEEPGTTRDVLEAETSFGGVPAVLVDVAGVREGDGIHPVEALGIARAKRELARADVTLLVVDITAEGERPPASDDAIVVYAKADLAPDKRPRHGIVVSAHSGAGLDELGAALRSRLVGDDEAVLDEVLLTRERQQVDVAAAHGALVEAARALDERRPDEVVAAELRRAGGALDRLLGKRLGDDVLAAIFSRFCIGK